MRIRPTLTLALLFAVGASLRPLAGQSARPWRPAIGLGDLVSDNDQGALARTGFSAYARLTWWPASGVSVLADGWVHAVSINHDVATAPCPPSTPCGFSSGTTALVLAPALQAREGYDRVTLLYRVGPTFEWFVRRAPASGAAAIGVRGGFSVLTSRRVTGLLLSVDYLRAFRHGGPRWFLPITVGWQF